MERNMKCKKLLRFYFNAGALNKSLDNILLNYACGGAERGVESCACKMFDVIEAKRELGGLWGYLNGVFEKFAAKDIAVLRFYGLSRTGVSRLPEKCRLEIKRLTARFCRRLGGLQSYRVALKLVETYYCLL